MVEFTGERVIPGQVNDELWSEHIARYAFARRYTAGKRVLDAGCGAGYGTAHLAQSAAHVTGVDVAGEAIDFAAQSYTLSNVTFLRGSCFDLPFGKGAFDVVVAFEVIEHLTDHRKFLEECARVLDPRGILLVSSPNKRYYAESREQTGPNPYHEHEFEAEEFHGELQRVFPAVQLLLQNRTECFVFYPATGWWDSDASVESRAGAAQDAHFLIGVCSFDANLPEHAFVYVVRAANLLREREQHIRLIESALRKSLTEHAELVELHRRQQQELEERNRWAGQLDADLRAAYQRIAALQDEFAAEQARAVAIVQAFEAKVGELEADNEAKARWALETEAHLTQELERTLETLDAKCRELAECVALLDRAETTVEERTLWAQRSEAQRGQLESAVRASRWVRLGRKIGLGPAIPRS